MPRGTTLENALIMLKGELGQHVTVAGGDNELCTYIDLVQTWLAAEWDWPFLEDEEDVELIPGYGGSSRYYLTPNISFDRPVHVTAIWAQRWYPVEFGIGADEYNYLSSGDGNVDAEQTSPVQKWRWKPGDSDYIEVWPLPQEAQTLRFTGQKPLPTLKSGGEYDPTAELALDDVLVVKFAAAQKLQRMEKKDSTIVLAQAEARLNRLRGLAPSKAEIPLILGGNRDCCPKKRHVVLMAAGSGTSATSNLVLLGTVEPEGNEAAAAGRLYFKTTAPQSYWLKLSGTGTTGWTELLGL